jgi:hypothetical protein
LALYPSLTDLSCETVPLGETIKEGWVEWICWQSRAISPSNWPLHSPCNWSIGS